jgi:hypothetical protein
VPQLRNNGQSDNLAKRRVLYGEGEQMLYRVVRLEGLLNLKRGDDPTAADDALLGASARGGIGR